MASEQRDEKQRPARPVRSPARAAAEHAPYLPTPYENADALSLQRLAAGVASEIEQKRALAWVMRCSGYLDEPYRPGSDDRDTNFALGKANIGRQIAKLLNLDLGRLRRNDGQA